MDGPRDSDHQEAKYKLKKYEHHLDDGSPAVQVNKRECTDIIMCLVFIAMIAVMVLITGFAMGYGDIDRITTKYDMDGQWCTGNHTFKLFTRIMPTRKYYNSQRITEFEIGGQGEFFHYSVCVSECPNEGTANLTFLPNSAYPNTTYKLNYWDHNTDVLMGFCVPDLQILKQNTIDLYNNLYSQLDDQVGGFIKYTMDIRECWKLVLIMGACSIGYTFVYFLLLKWITKPILYLSLLFIFLFGSLVTGWFVHRVYQYPFRSNNWKYSAAGASISGILTFLYVCFLCCVNITVGAEIMAAAGEFVAKNVQVVLLPIVFYCVCFPIVLWYGAAMVYLYSTGEPQFVQGKMFAVLESTGEADVMFWVFLFGFFWIIAFLIAILQFTIAATAALWYFNQNNSDLPSVSVCRGLYWAFRFHLGSLALGSLLITLMTMVKLIFEYFANKFENTSGQSVAVKTVLCCVSCMVWCLDSCVKFISENAVIQVAINGREFCEGAHAAFFLLVSNKGTYAAMNIVGWVLTAVGKGVICGLSVFVTVVLAQQNKWVATPDYQVQQPFVPGFLVLLISWLVASLFFTVFDFAGLTIMQCYLISKDVQRKSGGKVFPPKGLQNYLKKNGEEYEADKDAKDYKSKQYQYDFEDQN